MRESLKEGGAEIPAEAQTDITKFDPRAIDDNSLKKWFWWMNNSGSARVNTLSAKEKVYELCKGLLFGDFRAGIGIAVPGTTDLRSAMEDLKKDPVRYADYQDCMKVQSIIKRAQPQPVESGTPAVSTRVEPKPESVAGAGTGNTSNPNPASDAAEAH